jgi:DNA-directed RNA polymerase subunit F
MILSKKALTLAEVKELRKKSEEKKPIDEYLAKFNKNTKDKVKKMAEEIKALNNPKIKEEHIVKIIDLLPEDAEDLNKIFNEMGLTEEEANAILAIVKK